MYYLQNKKILAGVVLWTALSSEVSAYTTSDDVLRDILEMFSVSGEWKGANSAVIQNSVTSYTNSGNNVVGSGGTVHTGDAESNVSVYTNTNGSSGTSTIDISVKANDKTEFYQEEIPVSGKIDMRVHVSVGATSTKTIREIYTGDELIDQISGTTTNSKDLKAKESMYTFAEEHIQEHKRSFLGMVIKELKEVIAYVVSIFT